MTDQDSATEKPMAVIGAGIVGICCALALQREGLAVLLVDPEEPGSGASFGNAGLIAPGSCAPMAMPGIVSQVPGMLTDPLGALTIRWRHLPRLAPWLIRFMAASRPERVESISLALRTLYTPALDDLLALAREAGAEHLIKCDGRLELYETEQSFAKAAAKIDLWRRRGVNFEILNGAEIRELEPSLGREYAKGLNFPDMGHTTDPQDLSLTLAEHFRRKGGTILKSAVRHVRLGEGGPEQIETSGEQHDVRGVVLTAGAYSGKLAARLGHRVPLETERGYHMMLPNPGFELRHPLISGDHKFALTPMAGGLRLAGTVELASLEAPPNYARAEKLVQAARTMFPSLNAEGGEPWMGRRPSMPDSLPVISASPRHKGVFFAFGHGHLELPGAGVTGRLIADLVAGRQPPIDMAPYRVERF